MADPDASTAGPPGAADPPAAADPALSVIVLTLNEAHNIDDALDSLVHQDAPLEVIVVDSASTDETVARTERWVEGHPEVVRLVTSERHLPIGEARNIGLQHARSSRIAFMSADATAAPGWARALLEGLEDADVVYGRQEHDPPDLTVSSVVRGLRYHHFPEDATDEPDTYASNVNAGIRRDVFDLVRYVDDRAASALDDILFTRDVRTLGLRVAYMPKMLVRHKDAATLRQELRKNRREGYGWGILSPSLGLHRQVLLWAGALVAGLVAVAVFPTWWSGLILLALLYAPALRRTLRAGRRFVRTPHTLVGAIAVSPLFDLAFLFDYLRGLRHRRPNVTGIMQPQGA